MKETLSKYEIHINPEQEKMLGEFVDMFLEKNTQLNLSAIRDKNGVELKHILDSLILTRFFTPTGKVADIGTGGGFPGIPLKIFYGDELDITFIDSVGKKVRAVGEFCQKLGCTNYITLHARSEQLAKQGYANTFDTIFTRAVAYLPDLLDYSFPLLKHGGTLVCYKLQSDEEIKEGEKKLKKLGGKIQKTEHYILDGQKRILIFIKKD